MSIEVQFYQLTGAPTDPVFLEYGPTTGPSGDWDVAVDPIGGPAQVLDEDFGVTGTVGVTGAYLHFDLPDSAIKQARQDYIDGGLTGPVLRVIYNY